MHAASLRLALVAGCLAVGACAPGKEAPLPEGAGARLRAACTQALDGLAPDRAAAGFGPLELPSEVEPTLRALSGTGMGSRVDALDLELERAARIALRDVRSWLEETAASFAPPPDADASLVAAFRAKQEAGLRARLALPVERAVAGSHAREALAAVRDGAQRLPLRRSVELDLVSAVTERAVQRFFAALAEA